MSVISAAGRLVRDLIFLPETVNPSLVDVVRVKQPSEENREDNCSVCFDPAFQDLKNLPRRFWTVMHYEVAPPHRLLHPIHIECLAKSALHTGLLKCPQCRANINFASLEKAADLPLQIASKPWSKYAIGEISRIARRVWKRMPSNLLIGCLPVTGTLLLISSISWLRDPTGTVFRTLLWEGALPSLVGGVIGVGLGSFFASIILGLGKSLIEQMRFQPIPETIVQIVLVGITALIAFKIAALVGSIFSVWCVKAAVFSESFSEIINLGIEGGMGMMFIRAMIEY